MKEQGWIIAPRRRDGDAPSFTKGCYNEKAVHVYPSAADAADHLDRFVDSRRYAVFEVEITVKPIGRGSLDGIRDELGLWLPPKKTRKKTKRAK